MKLACLILAHDAPNQLVRLARALRHPDIDIFVHLDRKSPLEPGIFSQDVRLRFISARVNVWWGEYSLVAATLNLVADALRTGDYDYLILMSGSDYPLTSPERLLAFFHDNKGREFVNLLEMPRPEIGKRLERLTTYKLCHGFMGGAFDRLLPRLNRLLAKVVRRDYKKSLRGAVPYVGSQWWALSGAACRYLLDFVADANNAGFVRFFKHSSIPDEMFFQTIIGNSPYAARVRRNLTYTDWHRFGPPFPAWLNEWHVRQFLEQRPFVMSDAYGTGVALFARKFSDDSGQLTNQLDAALR